MIVNLVSTILLLFLILSPVLTNVAEQNILSALTETTYNDLFSEIPCMFLRETKYRLAIVSYTEGTMRSCDPKVHYPFAKKYNLTMIVPQQPTMLTKSPLLRFGTYHLQPSKVYRRAISPVDLSLAPYRVLLQGNVSLLVGDFRLTSFDEGLAWLFKVDHEIYLSGGRFKVKILNEDKKLQLIQVLCFIFRYFSEFNSFCEN